MSLCRCRCSGSWLWDRGGRCSGRLCRGGRRRRGRRRRNGCARELSRRRLTGRLGKRGRGCEEEERGGDRGGCNLCEAALSATYSASALRCAFPQGARPPHGSLTFGQMGVPIRNPPGVRAPPQFPAICELFVRVLRNLVSCVRKLATFVRKLRAKQGRPVPPSHCRTARSGRDFAGRDRQTIHDFGRAAATALRVHDFASRFVVFRPTTASRRLQLTDPPSMPPLTRVEESGSLRLAGRDTHRRCRACRAVDR